MSLIEVTDLYKTYHMGDISVPVLKGVSLSVNKGEFIALMGSSGSGKSTLMNILGCLDRPSSGEYSLEGEEISSLSTDRRARIRNSRIGFVFQSFNLLPRVSALENVIMPLAYASEHISSKEARERGTSLLEQFGISDRSHHEPSRLSGGQQQRVAIARSLVCDPPILLADEPTGNLDSQTGEEVLEIFKRLNKEKNLTIIMVTHDKEVAMHAQRVIHIKDGLIDNIFSGGRA
ncbi:MAG: ABC transporter ATP-binding protein [Lentisphaerota bacterium]